MSEEKIQDGGPAFPTRVANANGIEYPTAGMTLRQYYAAAALTGMIAGSQGLEITTDEFAAQSFRLADAMIAHEREGR